MDMLQRRTFLIGLGSTALGLVSSPLFAAPTWTHDAKDPRWVQGQVTAHATMDAVWAKLQRVPEWPQMFTDIKTMNIVERGTDHWRVKLETRTFDCGAHEYHVRFDSPRTARLWIDAPGVTALAYMRVLEGGAPEASRVVYSLFLEARGIAAWFHTKEDLRRKQERMVVQYLSDLERLFAPRAA
jgi:hypothetical protein